MRIGESGKQTKNTRIPNTNPVQLFDIRTDNKGKQPKNTRAPDTNLVQLFNMRIGESLSVCACVSASVSV